MMEALLWCNSITVPAAWLGQLTGCFCAELNLGLGGRDFCAH